jgi:hypothetical protein
MKLSQTHFEFLFRNLAETKLFIGIFSTEYFFHWTIFTCRKFLQWCVHGIPHACGKMLAVQKQIFLHIMCTHTASAEGYQKGIALIFLTNISGGMKLYRIKNWFVNIKTIPIITHIRAKSLLSFSNTKGK